MSFLKRLANLTPLTEEYATWADDLIRLRIQGYLSDEEPPLELVSSVRAIVFQNDTVLVTRNTDSTHISRGAERRVVGWQARWLLAKEVSGSAVKMIHKPKHRSSEHGMGLPSCAKTSQKVSPSILVTTEVWNEIGEPWRAPEGFVFADTGYKWVTTWEEGKNHTVTEFVGATGNLVGAYYDIGSIVTKTPGGFEYDDWYLDVFQPAGERPVLLDEDELEQAVQAGFLTEEQAKIARREAAKIMKELESRPSGAVKTADDNNCDVNLFDIWQRLDGTAVRELLSLSVGNPTDEKLSRICDQYRSLTDWRLLGCEVKGCIVGYIGLQEAKADEAIIHHIAVVETARRQGIGRAMLHAVRQELSLKRFTAETDADAVGFYRKCGFDVQSLGELHPGVERYRCEWDLK